MTASDAQADRITVTLVWSPRERRIESVLLELPADSTVRAALAASGRNWGMDPKAGVWGRKVALDDALHDGDRLEIYRALTVDPKRARRERFHRQGARTAGLFARRGPGAKPGA